MSFTVKTHVNISEVTWKLHKSMEAIRLGKSYLLAAMGEHGFHFLKEIAPEKTGRYKSSVQTLGTENRMVVGPTVFYAPYLEFGTRPSPGRYVPAIEKRLVDPSHPSFGMHPGIKPLRLVSQTRDEMLAFGRRVAEGIILREILAAID